MKYQVGDVVNAALYYYQNKIEPTLLMPANSTSSQLCGFQLGSGWVGHVMPLDKDVPEEQATALRQAYALARLAGQI